SVEQVLSWNPDIIIVGANAGDPAQLASDGVWSQLAAVKAGRVYRNPAGIFPWDRYSPELLLQVDWARQIVQTGHVDEAGMIAKMQQFYRQFYGITLRTEDARRMLAALPPE
ncbi:MAG: ABC transporter substrate-binding protein, partial [Gluconobacter sp.]